MPKLYSDGCNYLYIALPVATSIPLIIQQHVAGIALYKTLKMSTSGTIIGPFSCNIARPVIPLYS